MQAAQAAAASAGAMGGGMRGTVRFSEPNALAAGERGYDPGMIQAVGQMNRMSMRCDPRIACRLD